MTSRKLLGGIVAACLAATCTLGIPTMAAAQVPAPPAPPAGPPPADALLNNTGLHDIYFTINSKDWQTLKDNYLSNAYYPVDFRWGTTVVRNAGIRSRGTGSRSGKKPGLRLDFDRYTADQKFLGLKSLIIRNSTQDPSNMHEQLSMLFFRRMGLVAPREVYARLFINNAYAGLYSLVESVDKDFVGKNFGNDLGYLYKYDFDTNDKGYFFEYRTSNPADYVPKPFKPETHESDPQANIFERFVATINSGSDATFRTAIAEFMDLGELIRHVATEVFMADRDGFLGDYGMNNYYLYRLPENHQFKFIDWDKSEAFNIGPEYGIWHNVDDVPSHVKNRLWERTMAQPDLRNYYLDFLNQCADTLNQVPPGSDPAETRGWLALEAERQRTLIHVAVIEDPNKPFSDNQFEVAFGDVREFLKRRAEEVRRQVGDSRR